MRSSQLKTWSEDVLQSYLHDLTTAAYMGRNLLTEKYAYMMEDTHPEEYMQIRHVLPEVAPEVRVKIDEIVDINVDWQKEGDEKYPNLRAKGRPLTSKEDTPYQTSFETYLRGELKTYSPETIQRLHAYTPVSYTHLDVYKRQHEYNQQNHKTSTDVFIFCHFTQLCVFGLIEFFTRQFFCWFKNSWQNQN